jgi:predicted RNase H-like HicB family nuclease
MNYDLYLESGPRQRKTMVHVLDLLGCIARGPTTEEALAATPEAIRGYLRFLRRHGEGSEPESPFTTTIATHVMEGDWLGEGDPTPGFPPDFQPLSTGDLTAYLRRLEWTGADLLRLVSHMTAEQQAAEPAGGGRSISRILEHAAESQATYVRYAVGKVEGLSEALREARGHPEALSAALAAVWRISIQRLAAMSEVERTQSTPHGRVTWTARRGLRRMLEHSWEHRMEIAERLGRP